MAKSKEKNNMDFIVVPEKPKKGQKKAEKKEGGEKARGNAQNSAQGAQSKNDKGRFGIKTKLVLLASIPAVATALLIVIFSRTAMSSGMKNEALDGLFLMTEAIRGSFDQIEGDYSMGDDGCVYKGTVNLSPTEDSMDGYSIETDADVTLCWGKTRIVTSLMNEDGSRPVGTDIADDVWETLQKGEVYRTTKIKLFDKNYCAVYIPLEQQDGTVVGAIFAGRPSESITQFINSKVNVVILLSVFVLVVCAIVGYTVANGMAKALSSVSDALGRASQGRLDSDVEPLVTGRKDEIGLMGRELQTLIEKLRSVIGRLKQSSETLYSSGSSLGEMAGTSTAAADEISRAVEGISKGAASQAGEIETASEEIATMGEVIQSIVDNVGSLTDTSLHMSAAGDASAVTMQELSESNDRTTEAIRRIGEQIRTTNASVEKIGAAATLITSIADQTSLLSLNASIESARAGEAGRGFAVVAGEIQKLAVQSDEAAAEIQQIINTLLSESEQTMVVMNEAEELISEQQKKLADTKSRFGEVSVGISESREDTDVIKSKADSCNAARAQVVDIISNLSSISQEYAASAEETTTSMEELNETIGMLNDAAGNLKKLSEELASEVNFFQI